MYLLYKYIQSEVMSEMMKFHFDKIGPKFFNIQKFVCMDYFTFKI